MDKVTKCVHPIGFFKNDKGEEIHADCKMWSCPWCGRWKKKRVLDQIYYGFKGFRVRCLVLTEKAYTEQSKEIMQHWAKLRAVLHKKGYKFRYFWVKEFTVAGTRHLHILLSVYIPRAVIQAAWERITEYTAYIVWINQSGIRKAAGYMSKYMTKDMTDSRFGVHERRYGCSQKHFPKIVQLEMKLRGSEGTISFQQDLEKRSFAVPEKGTWRFVFDPLYCIGGLKKRQELMQA